MCISKLHIDSYSHTIEHPSIDQIRQLADLEVLLAVYDFVTVYDSPRGNGTAHFKKCKQLFEYKHLLLLRDIWWSKF